MKYKALEYNQVVNIVGGKHAGKSGNAVHCVFPNDRHIITVRLPEGDVTVMDDEIDFKFNAIGVKLAIPEDEHPEFEQRIRDYEEGAESI